GFPISERHIGGGLAAARWPGRLELICERPRIFLDGAHNPAGARALARFLDEELSSRRVILVYGAMRDKAVGEITEILFPKTAAVILTQPAQDRAAAPETIRELSGYLNPNVVIEPAPAAALARAMEMARAEDVILVTGSLYLIGDIKKHWAAREVAAADPNARPREATALRPRNA